jgi:hypothetical protein
VAQDDGIVGADMGAGVTVSSEEWGKWIVK